MTPEDTKQVDADHYFEEYDSFSRWISYHSQIELVRKYSNLESEILEVGIGNKTVYNYLKKQQNLDVTGMDIDVALEPDEVGSILDMPFKDNSFDIICAFEVLEHLPLDKLPKALKELSRVSRDKVIISVPHKAVGINFRIEWHYKVYFSKHLNFPIPLPSLKHEFDGEHYWELGSDKMSKNNLLEKTEKSFNLVEEDRMKGNTYHHFFVFEVLEK